MQFKMGNIRLSHRCLQLFFHTQRQRVVEHLRHVVVLLSSDAAAHTRAAVWCYKQEDLFWKHTSLLGFCRQQKQGCTQGPAAAVSCSISMLATTLETNPTAHKNLTNTVLSHSTEKRTSLKQVSLAHQQQQQHVAQTAMRGEQLHSMGRLQCSKAAKQSSNPAGARRCFWILAR